ncbi:hypothetical protein FH972_024925 [Carpinus fangiana]|uniref:Uncharacterized protein n=1 Tax=Carpinus fangiana TaxID=176857 RepID=A0A5N6L208_9ROSI|nr:hypothetical protein FH972_024925 [Carpinus fangiana]
MATCEATLSAVAVAYSVLRRAGSGPRRWACVCGCVAGGGLATSLRTRCVRTASSGWKRRTRIQSCWEAGPGWWGRVVGGGEEGGGVGGGGGKGAQERGGGDVQQGPEGQEEADAAELEEQAGEGGVGGGEAGVGGAEGLEQDEQPGGGEEAVEVQALQAVNTTLSGDGELKEASRAQAATTLGPRFTVSPTPVDLHCTLSRRLVVTASVGIIHQTSQMFRPQTT